MQTGPNPQGSAERVAPRLIISLLAKTMGEQRAEEIFRHALAKLPNPPKDNEFTLSDAHTLLKTLISMPGLIGIAAQLARAELRVFALRQKA
jgi:hypothetical protein